MSRFAATEQRLRITREKHPGFPRDSAAIVRLIKLLNSLTHDRGNDLLRKHGLSHPEYNVLMMIDGSPEGSLNPSLLGDAAGEKSANVTRLTSQLVDKGLITRTPRQDDRRMLELRLTAAGQALIAAFLPDINAQLGSYVEELAPAEQAQLEVLLKKLLVGVERAR